MKLNICKRNYTDKKWFAWYPVYWDHEGGRWIWLEFVYRKWSAWDKMWVITSKEHHDQAALAAEQYKRDAQKAIDAWDTSPLKDRGNDVVEPTVYSTKRP
jgi:hypothetical protein